MEAVKKQANNTANFTGTLAQNYKWLECKSFQDTFATGKR